MRSRRPRHDRGRDPRPDAPGLPWETPEAVADAELGARLERALHEGPGSGHVDVAQLLRGTRQATTRRARARRTALIAAAAVAVAAVPVGLQSARWMSSPAQPGTGSVSADRTPKPTPTATPSARPTPTAQATQTVPPRLALPPASLDDPTAVLYDIPSSVAFDAQDLQPSMVMLGDFGQYRWIPTVAGQACSDIRMRKLEQPVAGRQWAWAEESSNRLDQYQVQLVVTGWADEKSAMAQLGLIRRDTGACRFIDTVVTHESDSRTWIGSGPGPDGMAHGYTAVVVPGGLIAGISVTSPNGADDAIRMAGELAEVAERRIEQSGLTRQLLIRATAGGVRSPAASPGATESASPTPPGS